MEDGGLIAPNGKQSNLTSEQYKLVRTEAFKDWFGDWENDPKNSSKVVDENGEPLVMYHGTQNTFTIFEMDYIETGIDDKELKSRFWFTKNKELAESYSRSRVGDSKVYELFLNIRKPKNNDFNLYTEDDNDGVIEYNGRKNISVAIVTSSNQIKLADGTNTTFDGNNPDIRFEKGGVMSYREYVDSQFNEETDKYLPSGYLQEFEILRDKKDLYPILYRSKNGFDYRIQNNTNSQISVFDGDKMIGYADNKAIMVAPSYQKKGIGLELVTILKERNPDHRFGSMTPEGWNLLGKYYDEKIAKKSNSTFAKGGENLTNKELMANDFVNEQKELQRNSKYAILLDATWSNYTNEMREVYRDLQDEITKKLGYNPLVNYSPLSDNVILTFDDDSNLLGALEFTIEPQYTEVPRYSPSYIKPEPIFENNNNVFFIEYLFSFAKGNGQKIMNKLKQYAHKYNVDIGLYGSVVYREDQDKFMASTKHLQRFYDKQGFINVIGHYFLYSPNSMAKGGRTIAQTPAPASDRVSGSKTNPKGSASDTSLARSIKFNDSLLKAIENKVKAHNEEYPSKKVTTPTAKAVVRRGMGAYSKSHRPFITGGAPNSRQAWGLARLNKFLLKKRGVKVKSAYIQDDDLL
jgi:GNAT superfamily N-acetyltransferase